ncbi:LysR family transcriptional regulator [Microbacterium sp. H83]|uniref:LysR family transcriptional regulator n=1 Tax=Microbacterium sp. H83 TaxID=1827324 RepID=UPI000A84D62D|nr:LysR family transcriptional regulator [Microbacterium sp. H83]
MASHFPAPPTSADDLLVLLAVARSGRFTSAAQHLGLNHTTVARRIAALESQLGGRVLSRDGGAWELTPLGTRALAAAEAVEQALSGLDDGDAERVEGLIRLSATDGFSGFIAAPAMAAVRRRHPGVALEIVTGTRQAAQQRGAADLEVVVGRPQVHRARAVHLADYALGLYASRDFLRRHPAPADPSDLAGRPLVYFIESMLHVDVLDEARRLVPGMTDSVASTNVYVHVDATRGGAGFGLLPAFLADQHDDLVRVLPDQIEQRLPYWLVARPDALQQRAVAAFLDALQERLAEVRDALLGRR